MRAMPEDGGALSSLQLYIHRQARSWWRYILEQTIFLLIGWIPTIVGIGLRAVIYRLIMKMDGVSTIEAGVRIRFADQVHLGKNVYLDEQMAVHL